MTASSGWCPGHRLQQLGGVRTGRDDLEAAVGEHPGEPVPQQHESSAITIRMAAPR